MERGSAGSSANYGIVRDATRIEPLQGSDTRWATPNVAVLNAAGDEVKMIMWLQMIRRTKMFAPWGYPSKTLEVSVFRKLPTDAHSDAQCIAARQIPVAEWPPLQYMHVRMIGRVLKMELTPFEVFEARPRNAPYQHLDFMLDVDQAPSAIMDWGTFEVARLGQAILPSQWRSGVCRYPKWTLEFYDGKT